ncbi:hypothetical protein NFI96_031497, partial [Prochilodus magdalenae]
VFRSPPQRKQMPLTDSRVNEVIYASSRSPVAPGSDEERLQMWNKLKDHKEKLTVDPDSCKTPLNRDRGWNWCVRWRTGVI